MHHAFVLARIRLTRTAAERGPVLFGERGQGTLLHPAFVLARIRLTRTAAERGPVLFGACGQGVMICVTNFAEVTASL